jgi:long-chain acyl-CoA synthetase
MLYESWIQTARTHHDQVALRLHGKGTSWTFGQLAEIVNNAPCNAPETVFPRSNSVDFILTILKAWRDRLVVCPLEDNHHAPTLENIPADIIHVKLTSGTTGSARAVLFTEHQLAADATNIRQTMELSPDSPNLGVISLAHSYGFSNLFLPLVLYGIPLTLVPSPIPEVVRSALNSGSNWTLPAVPALWQTWFEADIIPTHGIRMAISAGAPLSARLEQSVFEKTHLKIHNFLGSSECGGIAFDRSTTPRQDNTIVGHPMENVSVSEMPSGELLVKSPAVASGYWPDSSDRLSAGQFLLNDIGKIQDGTIHLEGRAGDQINIAGRKLAPESIERALLKHPAVSNCLAFGIPSTQANRNEDIVILVTGSIEQPEPLVKFLRQSLPAWQVPRHWKIVNSLKPNSRGKVSRKWWQKQFLKELKE